MLYHPGACDHVALAATWPMAVQAPHSSRREPEVDSSRKQAKLPGWGLRPLSSCLWAPKDCPLKRSKNPGHWLSSWFCCGARTNLCPFAPAHASVWLLWQQAAELLFLFSYKPAFVLLSPYTMHPEYEWP